MITGRRSILVDEAIHVKQPKHRSFAGLGIPGLLLFLLGCSFNPEGRPARLTIATTTSVEQSGLLGHLLPAFQRESGIDVLVHTAGSGRALQMMAREEVALVISHAPDAEARALGEHLDWVYEKIAFNDFVIVGPPADPANISRAASAVDAFGRLARSSARFVSRGDQSGTHEREERLWREAGRRPADDQMIVSGRGMAQALRHADEIGGYTLSDEATFRQFETQHELVILYRGDTRLLNGYAVMYPRGDPLASRFGDWLVRGSGRGLIERYSVNGRRQFTVWPTDCPGTAPQDPPCVDSGVR